MLNSNDDIVVPHEGTWIEILIQKVSIRSSRVVPHEGTWIEIIKDTHPRKEESVVPHEGTWIEISRTVIISVRAVSFPTRERGLKFQRIRRSLRIRGRSPRGNVD